MYGPLAFTGGSFAIYLAVGLIALVVGLAMRTYRWFASDLRRNLGALLMGVGILGVGASVYLVLNGVGLL